MAVLMMLIAPPGVGADAQPASPRWVLDPMMPGADLPPAGASLFDHLTIGRDGRQHIPFPFERLIAHIETAAGCKTTRPCTRAALIPIGRSLQRVAASPDFFAHPRAVVAVVGEGSGRFLRDRLFIGYQEKSGVIEVISYNETLGRFEFQVVNGYAPGGMPVVTYGRRTVCVACHQNQGPIFSQPLWLETNANPQVAERLSEQREKFFGITARGNTDITQAIDDATDRASRLALTQRLWTDGCGSRAEGEQCRRAALLASLQFALSGRREYRRSNEFEGSVVRTLTRQAQSRWPAGLALSGADIPNRNSLDLHEGTTALLAANIEPRFDPLAPRPPSEVVASDGSDRLVRGAADFWPDARVAALTDALSGVDAATEEIRLPCRVLGAAATEEFDCESPTARLRGSLGSAAGSLEAIAIGSPEAVRHLQLAIRRRPGRVIATALSNDVPARLPSGDAIQQIQLSWHGSDGEAVVRVRRDFSALAAVANRMQFPQLPLTLSVLDSLTAQVAGRDIPPPDELRPVASADSYAPASAQREALARQFESQCGSCHHTAAITPPNFLSGDTARVRSALASCGPRIFVRLAMRNVPESRREKSPMPPAIPSAGSHAWKAPPADERALVELQAAVGAALQREYGREVGVEELLSRGYEALRPCLPGDATESEHGRHAS